MASPPAWLLAALAAPHVFALLPLLARKQLAGVAARLGHTDAAVPYTAGSLVLGCGQAGAVLQWLVESRSDGVDAALPLTARVALATPLLIAGALLKLGAARVLRRSGLYFGRQLHAARDCALPLSSDWPYSLLAHPDYCGSALLLLGGACLVFAGPAAPEGGMTVLLFWEFLYAASAMAEEAYGCADQQQPVLKPGQNPFWNNIARPENNVEKARQLLMAPVALLRCCIFWSALFAYGVFVTFANKFYKGNDRQRHAMLVPVTQVATRIVMWCCGYSLTINGAANLAAAQREAAASNSSYEIVVNHLSYMDIMVCAAVFGPYSAVARHDLLDWPIVGPVARAWGVVGVVQSDIREKELSASKVPADGAAPSAEAAKPSGRAAALAARAALPGSGWALPPVLVFPEGTTTGGGCLVTFRSGAFVGGTPVLPVTLRYSVPSGFNLCWAAPLGTGAHFWKTMCAWGKHVDVDILPLHRPAAAELADAHVFAEAVRDEMAAALHWPAVNGWSVREAHALIHELSHGGGPLSRAAIAAATGAPVVAGEVEAASADYAATAAPPVAQAPLPPLPPASPAALAARHRGGSGTDLFPPGGNGNGNAGVVPGGLARTSSSPDSRLRGRCPSPKQA